MRSRGAATLIACVLVLPAAGCYQGDGNTVSDQEATGNGTQLTVGDSLEIQGLTIVAGQRTGGAASVVMTMVNTGDTPDGLTEVQVAGAPATVRTAPIAVKPGVAVQVGGDSPSTVTVPGLATPTGSYATVVLKFQRAGVVTTESLVVPQVGYYEDFGATGDSATPVADKAASSPAPAGQ